MGFFFNMLLTQPIPWAATLNIYKVPQKSLKKENIIHFKDPNFQLLNGFLSQFGWQNCLVISSIDPG